MLPRATARFGDRLTAFHLSRSGTPANAIGAANPFSSRAGGGGVLRPMADEAPNLASISGSACARQLGIPVTTAAAIAAPHAPAAVAELRTDHPVSTDGGYRSCHPPPVIMAAS